jgi:hypothetical protein
MSTWFLINRVFLIHQELLPHHDPVTTSFALLFAVVLLSRYLSCQLKNRLKFPHSALNLVRLGTTQFKVQIKEDCWCQVTEVSGIQFQ